MRAGVGAVAHLCVFRRRSRAGDSTPVDTSNDRRIQCFPDWLAVPGPFADILQAAHSGRKSGSRYEDILPLPSLNVVCKAWRHRVHVEVVRVTRGLHPQKLAVAVYVGVDDKLDVCDFSTARLGGKSKHGRIEALEFVAVAKQIVGSEGDDAGGAIHDAPTRRFAQRLLLETKVVATVEIFVGV